MLAALIAIPKPKSAASPSNKLALQHSTLIGHLPGPIQAKLVVGKVDDPFEREADRIADAVMSAPVSAPPVTPSPLRISRKCAACEEEEEEGKAQTVQTKREGSQQTVSSEPLAGVRETIRSPGQQFDPAARAFFEPRFGHDFSRVKVHADGAAAESARQIGALAYTVESHVVFGGGQYAPDSSSGRRLLAHELVHVIQQGPTAQQADARKGPPEVTRDLEQSISSKAGQGQPLRGPDRAFFENRLGHDFSRVRVHDDSSSAEISARLYAEAFTVRNDIFFNSGRYHPNRPEGRHLLAHELTHVVQQTSGTSGPQIQRARIPYGALAWTDFQKAAPADSEWEAETSSGFHVPDWDPVTDSRATGKPCTLKKKPAKEFTATVSIPPTAFDTFAAEMTQEESWVKDQYKTPAAGAAYCKTVKGARCEEVFDANAPWYSVRDDENKDVAKAVTKAECSSKKFQDPCAAHQIVQSAWILKHEQRHFDLSNVMALKAKADLRSKAATFTAKATACGENRALSAAHAKFNSLGATRKLTKLVQDWFKLKTTANTAYDHDTRHGVDHVAQATWEGKIAGGLTAYDLNAAAPGSTSAPPATAPAPPVTAPTTPAPVPVPAPRAPGTP